ncbi:DUF5714 domain-containing protein [Thermosulfidibacter takaii]|uniref:DUF5714 domain-containing protein n=1 Tax=Thermosulfidibacter takaii TaxID=412593 RepID=UPI0008386056|nr:DUF5714 domain-containing protein [Thermosulfidibacter takaii]
MEAEKPKNLEKKVVYYTGDSVAVFEDDRLFLPAQRAAILTEYSDDELLQKGFFVLDGNRYVKNADIDMSCCCVLLENEVQKEGCLVCGADVVYLNKPRRLKCSVCGRKFMADAVCEKGHYVCDVCHSKDPVRVIKEECIKYKGEDPVELMVKIRSHPNFPIHGPHHHAMVAGIVLTVCRNKGIFLEDEAIESTIERGMKIPGGVCAFWGICGAAMGVGLAFSVIAGANPVTAKERNWVQRVVHRLLDKILEIEAPRCCQRESYLVLKELEDISREFLPFEISTEYKLACTQKSLNKECIGDNCPLFVSQFDSLKIKN